MLKKKKINKKNLITILNNIQKLSPHPEKVNILAVTKNLHFTAIKSATQNNLFNIGENRIQETREKTTNQKLHKKTKIHFIGQLQSNKIKKVVKTYNVIQSVGRMKILKKINNFAEQENKKQKIFLQINIARTKTQSGFNKKEITQAAAEAKKLPFIKNIGIMAIGPHTKNKKKIIEKFKEIKQIQEEIYKKTDKNCTELSIGMSQDYLLALKAGSTYLRLGTLLFKK